MVEKLRGGTMSMLKPVLDARPRRPRPAPSTPQPGPTPRSGCWQDKGWNAMGAFDPAERSHVLDLFGFEGQLVFATFATAQFVGKDQDLLYAGSAAHNHAVVDFCKDDPRLLPVAYRPARRPRACGRAAAVRPSTSAAPRSMCRRPRPASGAHPSRPVPVLVDARRLGRAVRPPRRRRRPPARPRLPQQRHAR